VTCASLLFLLARVTNPRQQGKKVAMLKMEDIEDGFTDMMIIGNTKVLL